MRLTAKLVAVAELTPPERNEMFALMDEHYANIHRQRFEQDLAEKRWAASLAKVREKHPSAELLIRLNVSRSIREAEAADLAGLLI